MFPINPLVADTGSPPIPEAQAWLRAYDGRAGAAVNLSQAVPGTAPHPDLLERFAVTAGDAAFAGYGPICGDMLLREAYAAEVARSYGAAVGAADVAITSGCNQAFVIAMMALAKAGENVILPSPWYFNHKMTLDMLGVGVKTLPCAAEDGFVPDVDIAEALIDGATRAIVLVTPNNPTGAIYPPTVIEAFQALCLRRGLRLVLDETYRDFLAPGARPHGVLAASEWRGNVLQLYSFSKAFCIPGHRLGAIAADAGMIGEIAKLLDCVQICPPRVAQPAVAWGIDALRGWREENRAEMERRGAALRRALAKAQAWRLDSLGAYFAYVRQPVEGADAAATAERLAREQGVLTLPGSYFAEGPSQHLRVAFANVPIAMVESVGPRFAAIAA